MSTGRAFIAMAVLIGGLVSCIGCAPDSGTNGAKAVSASRPAVAIEDIKLEPLLAKIAEQKGKVVVVDTWASWCIPCKQEFPHLVELSQRHRADPVSCMSVTIDEPEGRDAALAFLKKTEATFANYRVTDGTGWQDKWEIKSIPVVLVFGQDGKLAKKFDMDDPDHQFTYEQVEQLVSRLLKKPA